MGCLIDMMKTKRIAIDGIMAALYVILGYISIDMGMLKISFEEFPVILSGLVLGPVDGVIVGGIGTFLFQILRYGFSATTLMWMLPYIVCGLVCGLYASKYGFYNSGRQLWFIITVAGFVTFALNTLAIYVDSKVYGYYSDAYVFGALGIRLIIMAVKTVVFGFLAMPVLRAMARITGRKKSNNDLR